MGILLFTIGGVIVAVLVINGIAILVGIGDTKEDAIEDIYDQLEEK
jgi:hypothetical protein